MLRCKPKSCCQVRYQLKLHSKTANRLSLALSLFILFFLDEGRAGQNDLIGAAFKKQCPLRGPQGFHSQDSSELQIKTPVRIILLRLQKVLVCSLRPYRPTPRILSLSGQSTCEGVEKKIAEQTEIEMFLYLIRPDAFRLRENQRIMSDKFLGILLGIHSTITLRQ